MFEELLNKDIFTALINAPKIWKELDNKRIDVSALEFICATPVVTDLLKMSDKEQKAVMDFVSAFIALNITKKGKELFNEPVQKVKNEMLAKFTQTEIPPENTAKVGEPKKDEAAADAADAAQTESIKSKLPEDLQKLLDDPDVPEKIKKAIMAAADVDADIEIIRVKGKKG